MFLADPKQKYFSLSSQLSMLIKTFIILQPRFIPFQLLLPSLPFQPLHLSSHRPEIRSDSIWLFGLDGIINLQNKNSKMLFDLSIYSPFHILHLSCSLNTVLSQHTFLLYMLQILLFVSSIYSTQFIFVVLLSLSTRLQVLCPITDKIPEYLTTECQFMDLLTYFTFIQTKKTWVELRQVTSSTGLQRNPPVGHRTKLRTDFNRKRNHCRVALLWKRKKKKEITDDSYTSRSKDRKDQKSTWTLGSFPHLRV